MGSTRAARGPLEKLCIFIRNFHSDRANSSENKLVNVVMGIMNNIYIYIYETPDNYCIKNRSRDTSFYFRPSFFPFSSLFLHPFPFLPFSSYLHLLSVGILLLFSLLFSTNNSYFGQKTYFRVPLL